MNTKLKAAKRTALAVAAIVSGAISVQLLFMLFNPIQITIGFLTVLILAFIYGLYQVNLHIAIDEDKK